MHRALSSRWRNHDREGDFLAKHLNRQIAVAHINQKVWIDCDVFESGAIPSLGDLVTRCGVDELPGIVGHHLLRHLL